MKSVRPAAIGFQRWDGGIWTPASPGDFPRPHGLLLDRFLDQARSPFAPELGRPWFGPDDLAYTPLRPRHAGLDAGARMRTGPGASLSTLNPGVPFRTIVPGGYTLGGKNLQRVIGVLREPLHRFRLVVQIAYDHARFEGEARGRVRCFSAADQAAYLHTPAAYGVAIRSGNRIVGYEALDWIRNPGGWTGILAEGKFVTKDPELARRKVPKGPHLHLRVDGIFDHDLPRKREFLNVRLRGRLEEGSCG